MLLVCFNDCVSLFGKHCHKIVNQYLHPSLPVRSNLIEPLSGQPQVQTSLHIMVYETAPGYVLGVDIYTR